MRGYKRKKARKTFYSNDEGQVRNSFIVRKIKERKEEIMKIERDE